MCCLILSYFFEKTQNLIFRSSYLCCRGTKMFPQDEQQIYLKFSVASLLGLRLELNACPEHPFIIGHTSLSGTLAALSSVTSCRVFEGHWFQNKACFFFSCQTGRPGFHSSVKELISCPFPRLWFVFPVLLSASRSVALGITVLCGMMESVYFPGEFHGSKSFSAQC